MKLPATKLTLNGVDYVLRGDVFAWDEVEQELGLPMSKVLEKVSASITIREVAIFVAAFARRGDPERHGGTTYGDVMAGMEDAEGYAVARKAVNEAVNVSLPPAPKKPDSKGGDGTSPENPRSPT